ncbi:MAG: hypothetical protein H6729_01190 [Deltaproteobacteria bacterium]|nr:hypothetical protein [Deltaproteobacteria bacterium]
MFLLIATGCGEGMNAQQSDRDLEDTTTSELGLVRFYPTVRSLCPKSGWSDHVSAWLRAPSGCQLEYTLGKTAVEGAYLGDKSLWNCTVNTARGPESFTSTDRNCEGQGYAPSSAFIGMVWNAPSSSRHPVYRCRMWDGEHFDSIASNCEGFQLEHMHGYMY